MEKKQITDALQNRLGDVCWNPDIAQAIATALTEDLGYQSIPEPQLKQIEIEAKKLASEAESAQARATYTVAARGMDALWSCGIPAFLALDAFLELLTSSRANYTQGAIITGSAGIGKTKRVVQAISGAKLPYTIYNSYSTPLAMYESLYLNNGKTVVFDDTTGILQDRKSISILKAALFSATGERLITYSSTAKVLEERGIPQSFIFTGRIIIILNEIPATLRESFQALLSRVYYHNVALTLDEKKLLVRYVFSTDTPELRLLDRAQKEKLLTMMEGVLDFSNAHKYNVRTALRAAEIYLALGEERAQELIFNLLEVDTRLRHFLLVEKYGDGQPVEKRVEAYIKSTGYSRRGYFDLKARYYGTRYGMAQHSKTDEEEVKKLFSFIGGST